MAQTEDALVASMLPVAAEVAGVLRLMFCCPVLVASMLQLGGIMSSEHSHKAAAAQCQQVASVKLRTFASANMGTARELRSVSTAAMDARARCKEELAAVETDLATQVEAKLQQLPATPM
eukprot:gene13743-19645_t